MEQDNGKQDKDKQDKGGENMYLAGGLVMALYLVLAFLSGKEKTEKKENGIFGLFHKMALWIYKRCCILKLPLFVSGQVENDLKKLCPGEGKERVRTEYYIRKLSLFLVILFVGTLFGMAAEYSSRSSLLLDKEGKVSRGSYREGSIALKLKGKDPQKELGIFQIEVAPVRLTDEELQNLSDEFMKSIPELILGENASAEQVTGDLALEEGYDGYPFFIEWKSDRPDVVGTTGRVYPQTEEMPVKLYVRLIYEEYVREEVIELTVMQEALTPKEQERADLEAWLVQSEQDSRDQEIWQLPGEWKGEAFYWEQETENYSLGIWAAAFGTAVAVYHLSDHDLHEQTEKRKKKMKQDYPDIVHKLALFAGAGMTVRGAFQKLAADYKKEKGKGMAERPAYEEILYTCRELRAGVSEGAAYEHFGKRTGLQEYVRLCALLTQNLKKGSGTLLERLKEEAEKSGEERLQNSKRLGEEAGTRLLVPMVLMLVVVMVIIMIPAFSTML